MLLLGRRTRAAGERAEQDEQHGGGDGAPDGGEGVHGHRRHDDDGEAGQGVQAVDEGDVDVVEPADGGGEVVLELSQPFLGLGGPPGPEEAGEHDVAGVADGAGGQPGVQPAGEDEEQELHEQGEEGDDHGGAGAEDETARDRDHLVPRGHGECGAGHEEEGAGLGEAAHDRQDGEEGDGGAAVGGERGEAATDVGEGQPPPPRRSRCVGHRGRPRCGWPPVTAPPRGVRPAPRSRCGRRTPARRERRCRPRRSRREG